MGTNDTEICENCGRAIGKLETAHVHGDHVVCGECQNRLVLAAQPVSAIPVVRAMAPTYAAAPMEGATTIVSHGPSVVQVQTNRETNALGVVSLILGCLALPLGMVPGCGLAALPMAAIALLCGLIGLSRGPRVSKGSALAGMVISIIPVIIQGMVLVAFVAGAAKTPTGTVAGATGKPTGTVAGAASRPTGASSAGSAAPAAAGPAPRVAASQPAGKAEREKAITMLQDADVLGDVSLTHGVGKVVAGRAFARITFQEKQIAMGVVYAWCRDQDHDCDLVLITDRLTGKKVGRYSPSLGLELE